MSTLADHDRWLGEHERRLGSHDVAIDAIDRRVTSLRIDLAKLVAYASLIVVICSGFATALIVHYLTPVASPARVSSR